MNTLVTENIYHLTEDTLHLTKDALTEFYIEGELPGKLNYDHLMGVWADIVKKDTGTIIAYVEDGIAQGLLGALLYQDWTNADMVVMETFWYVRKQYRGTSIGRELFKEFERWAKDSGAVRILMVHLDVINSEKLEKLYTANGYRKLEIIYSKDL